MVGCFTRAALDEEVSLIVLAKNAASEKIADGMQYFTGC